MDGLGREEYRDRENGTVLDVGEQPPPQIVDVTEDEDEGAPSFFSKWTLPIVLFLLTVFTTLWAGAYQTYNGPARGPLNFLLTSPELLWRGIP
ncbi:MAG TPA: hypothetical protein DDY39_20055, partial [Nitrospira sp.]|nr:hypothetical protein [Nitrospira sp.]